jgi:hypothetical protein
VSLVIVAIVITEVAGEVVVVWDRRVCRVIPPIDEAELGEAGDLTPWVADEEGRDHRFNDEDQHPDRRKVRDVVVTVEVSHPAGTVLVHTTNLTKNLEGAPDTRLVPVLRRVVGGRYLHQAVVRADDPELRLLMADESQAGAPEVDGAATDGRLAEVGVLEHDHHSPVGGGGQSAGRIAATLL